MQGLEKLMLERATALLQSGEVDKVIGWKKGESYYDVSPATFTKDNLEGFVYNCFCGANLSKYLVAESKKENKDEIVDVAYAMASSIVGKEIEKGTYDLNVEDYLNKVDSNE